MCRLHLRVPAPLGGRRPPLQDGFHSWDKRAVAPHVLSAVRTVRPDLVSCGVLSHGFKEPTALHLPGLRAIFAESLCPYR